MKQEKLIRFYNQAKVYAQPSIWEVFGMAIFEAASFNCNLAITSEGGAKDYLLNNALYCQPNDLTSIRTAILTAWKATKEKNRKNSKCFNWEESIEKTIEAYKKVLI